jgi:hypothetical protein
MTALRRIQTFHHCRGDCKIVIGKAFLRFSEIPMCCYSENLIETLSFGVYLATGRGVCVVLESNIPVCRREMLNFMLLKLFSSVITPLLSTYYVFKASPHVLSHSDHLNICVDLRGKPEETPHEDQCRADNLRGHHSDVQCSLSMYKMLGQLICQSDKLLTHIGNICNALVVYFRAIPQDDDAMPHSPRWKLNAVVVFRCFDGLACCHRCSTFLGSATRVGLSTLVETCQSKLLNLFRCIRTRRFLLLPIDS